MTLNIYYFKTAGGNFGDDFNGDFWRWMLPDKDFRFVHNSGDHDPRLPLITGVGTILDQFVPPASRLVVFGSGAGYHDPRPLRSEDHVYFVRGKDTARLIGADVSRALTDPAMLVQTVYEPSTSKVYDTGLIPHFGTKQNHLWRHMCSAFGFKYIDPCKPPQEVADHISQCRRVVTEAMHGAIFADGLRVPWLPVSASKYINHLKWRDWMDGLELKFEPAMLHIDYEHPLKRPANPFLRRQSIKNLKQSIDANAFLLSDRQTFEEKRMALMDQVEAFRSAIANGDWQT